MSAEWYKSLDDPTRERLFAAMRKLDAESTTYWAKAQKLAPPAGMIAVGGGSFEQLLKAEVIASYLRALRKGASPELAKLVTKGERTTYVKNFNKQRGNDYVVHRALDTEKSLIERVHEEIMGVMG